MYCLSLLKEDYKVTLHEGERFGKKCLHNKTRFETHLKRNERATHRNYLYTQNWLHRLKPVLPLVERYVLSLNRSESNFLKAVLSS